MKRLLLGGARSGKSALAVRVALEHAGPVCCIVTALAGDAEMTARIAMHRAERPPHWRTREEPLELGAALRAESLPESLTLVDCLSLWTANALWPRGPDGCADASQPPQPERWRALRADFLAALAEAPGEVIVVSNEVGLGLVPADAPSRLYRDEHGWLNQAAAAACDAVFWVSAGLPLRLK